MRQCFSIDIGFTFSMADQKNTHIFPFIEALRIIIDSPDALDLGFSLNLKSGHFVPKGIRKIMQETAQSTAKNQLCFSPFY